MNKIGLVLASVSCAVTAQAITIFDDFNTGNTYQPNLGYTIGGPQSIDAVAAPFTAAATGFLSTVDLGLTYPPNTQAGQISAFLYADLAGTPNNASQIFLGSGTPTAVFNTTNNSVVSFNVAGTAPVIMGTNYWLVLKIADPDSQWDVWMFNSIGATGDVQRSGDGTNWLSIGETLPAFRLLASELPPGQTGNGVPDSGGTFAMLAGAVTVLVTLREWRLRLISSRNETQ